MAKRKKRYGTMEISKVTQAANKLRALRRSVSRARSGLRSDYCADAIKNLMKAGIFYGEYETMKRAAGRSETWRQEKAGVPAYSALEKLRGEIVNKCVHSGAR